jgi:hypothetical protein
MDLFVVPTIGFDLLYAYIIVRLDRRELVWISVTTNPTAEWVARQVNPPAGHSRPCAGLVQVLCRCCAGFRPPE